jgi:hypothetical protein
MNSANKREIGREFAHRARRWLLAHGTTTLGALVLTDVFWVLARRLTYAGINYDETFFLWGGWSITRGLVPYRDFQDFKPPMVFLTNALAVALFGVPHQRFALFFAGLTLASYLTLYLALVRRGAGRALATVVVALIAYTMLDRRFHDSSLDDAESIGMAFYLLGVAGLLWGGRRVALARALGAASLALAVLSKEPYVFVVSGTAVTIGYVERYWNPGTTWRRYARDVLTGAGLVVAAMVTYLSLSGGLGSYLWVLRAYLSFDDIYAKMGGRPPLSGAAAFALSCAKLRDRLVNIDVLFAFLPFFAGFVIAIGKRWGGQLAMSATVIGALFAVTLGHSFFAHYFILGMAGIFLWAALGSIGLTQVMRRILGSARPRWRSAVIATTAALAVARIDQRYLAESVIAYRPNDYIGYGSAIPPEVIAFVAANSTPADTVLTDGSPGVYVFAGRRNATRESTFLDEYVDLYPGGTDEERLAPIRNELVARLPAVVYLDPAHEARKGRHRQALLLPFLREFHYRQVGRNFYLRP